MLKKVVVFAKNTWFHVPLPVGHDPSWLEADALYYGTVFLAAAERFPTSRAVCIAEAAVSKRLYPGLVYDKSIEEDLRITRKEHETP